MAKWLCPCGHVVRDQSDSLPYKAAFVPDEDQEEYVSRITQRFLEFLRARDEGKREVFLERIYGGDWAHSMNDQDVVEYLLYGSLIIARLIYECENCGRIWIQKHAERDKNVFGSYLPETEIRGVLQSQRKREQQTRIDNVRDKEG